MINPDTVLSPPKAAVDDDEEWGLLGSNNFDAKLATMTVHKKKVEFFICSDQSFSLVIFLVSIYLDQSFS